MTQPRLSQAPTSGTAEGWMLMSRQCNANVGTQKRRDVLSCKRREPNEISAPRRASAEREGAPLGLGLGPLACMHA